MFAYKYNKYKEKYISNKMHMQRGGYNETDFNLEIQRIEGLLKTDLTYISSGGMKDSMYFSDSTFYKYAMRKLPELLNELDHFAERVKNDILFTFEIDRIKERLEKEPTYISSGGMKDSEYVKNSDFYKYAMHKLPGLLINEHLAENLKRDTSFIIYIIKQEINSRAIKFASTELQNDPGFISLLVTDVGFADDALLEHIKKTPSLASNKDLIKNIIKQEKTTRAIKSASDEVQKDPDFIFTLFKETEYLNGFLEHIKNNHDLANNRELIKKIVLTNHPIVLQYASYALQNNKNFIESIIIESRYVTALQYASNALKNDANFILQMFEKKKDIELLDYISDNLKNNSDFMVKIITILDKTDIHLNAKLQRINDTLINDKDVLFTLFEKFGTSEILKNVEDKLKENTYLPIIKYIHDMNIKVECDNHPKICARNQHKEIETSPLAIGRSGENVRLLKIINIKRHNAEKVITFNVIIGEKKFPKKMNIDSTWGDVISEIVKVYKKNIDKMKTTTFDSNMKLITISDFNKKILIK